MRTLHVGVKIGLALIASILLLITGFIGVIMASFGTPNVYTRLFYPNIIVGIFMAIGIVFLLYLFTKIKGAFLGFGLLGVAVIALGTGMGAYFYGEHIEALRIQERGINLYEYQPFSYGNKLASLVEEATFQMPENELIRLDGATALYPVYAAFVEATYPHNVYDPYAAHQGGSNVVCTQTHIAYRRLVEGDTDMIFVAGPSKEQEEAAKHTGITLKFTPIGREAFVFFVHEDNPIDSLTIQEIQSIYAGDVTSWDEVGGTNDSIMAFQRPRGSGSQTALINIMGGIPIMTPDTEYVIGGMGGIITQTASYRNHKNAIGYSFRYFSQELVGEHAIKHLSVNGVYPSKDSIRDETYPIAASFYAVTVEEYETDTTRAFLDWILSEQGQKLVEASGYVGINP